MQRSDPPWAFFLAQGPREPQGESLGEDHAAPERHGQAYLMVICGLSPLSDFSPIRISRMVWDQ